MRITMSARQARVRTEDGIELLHQAEGDAAAFRQSLCVPRAMHILCHSLSARQGKCTGITRGMGTAQRRRFELGACIGTHSVKEASGQTQAARARVLILLRAQEN